MRGIKRRPDRLVVRLVRAPPRVQVPIATAHDEALHRERRDSVQKLRDEGEGSREGERLSIGTRAARAASTRAGAAAAHLHTHKGEEGG